MSAAGALSPRPAAPEAERRVRVLEERAGVQAEQIGWSLCALVLVFWGIRLWTGSNVVGWINASAVGITFVGLALFCRVWVGRGRPHPAEQAVLVGALGASVLLWGYLQVVLQPAYGTDAVAFAQYAADLVLHGKNPYVESMAPSLQQFLVPSIYHTYLLDGTPVDSVSYPALAFLVHVPALLLGIHMQAAVLTTLVFWVGSCVLLWRLLPTGLGWAAGVLIGLLTYASFAVGGVTDALFLPFVLVAVWRWDRYGDPREPGLARWIGPVALGLAMGVKQLPWFLLPFLVVGVAREARLRGTSGLWQAVRYVTVAGGVFAAVNGPFIAADPVAWARAVTVPLASPMVAGGQGLVNLSLFEQLGGVLVFYKIAGALAFVSALAALALYYARTKRAWTALVPLVFFWPARSFASYLVDLAPAALLAATTVRPTVDAVSQRLRRLRPIVLSALVAGLAAAAAGAVLVKPPLRVAVLDTRSTGQQGSIDGIRVRVTNTSDRPLRPHFTVVKGGYLTTFWYRLPRGRREDLVPPHATRTLWLRAPNADSMPGLTGGFVVEAFTTKPAAVSASRNAPPSPERLVLNPDAINVPVAVGRPVRIAVRLVDRLGDPIRRAGVRVALAQVVYGQHALVPGQASINGLPEGMTPVTERTAPDGVARFSVRGVQAQADPVFFQAWISPPRDVPHGYSNLLTIQFTEEVPR